MITAVFYAPHGSGKTTHAATLQSRFGCLGVVDGWHSSMAIKLGYLHLTNSKPCAINAFSNPMINQVTIFPNGATVADFLGVKW